jgi:diguanylate cyclase (GGDEF)-like protein
MGGSNQSLFLISALVLTQGSAAVPLLIVGLLLAWAAAPGWTELTLMWPERVGGIAATCAEAFRRYNPVLANLTGVCYWWGWVPTCGLTAILSATALHDWYLPGVPITALAIVIVTVFAALNLSGITRTTRIVTVIAVGSGALAFLSALVPILHGDVHTHQALSWTLLQPFRGAFGSVSSAMAGLYLIGFAAPAFEAATCHVGEMRDPAKSLPKAMKASAGMAGLYFLVLPLVWLGMFGAGPLGAADGNGGLAHLLGPTFTPLFGAAGQSVAVWFMVLNMFHGTAQPLAGASRTLSQLSDDGLLPRLVGRRNRHDAPHMAIVLTAGFAIVFLVAGDPVWLIAAANFTYLIGIALPSIAVFLLRRDFPDWPRPWRAPRGTVGLGVAAAVVWLASTVLGFRQFGLPVVLFGLALAYSGCAFYAWRWHTDRVAEGRPGTKRSLHFKLTGSMLAVMVLDGAGYLLAVTTGSHVSPDRVALLEDIFVAVAILTISVGLILPGMVAHSVTEVAEAARTLSTGTLADLSRAMDALGRGDLDEAWVSPTARPVQITSRDEVGAMGIAFNQMLAEIGRSAAALEGARRALRRSRGDLEYLATHDSLTTLPNRRHIEHEAQRIVDACIADGRRCAVVALDLDGFKYINDSRGHATGDLVLARVAELFRAHLRPDDFVGRLGGDEFAAVLPDISQDEARATITRLLDALRHETIDVEHGRGLQVTCSAGLAVLAPGDPQTAQDLLVEADVALYQAKNSGRDRVALYSTLDPRQADAIGRHPWVERIQDALESDRFVLHAQPILNLRSDSVDRYEVLLRMIDIDGTIVMPGQFLGAAERSGLITRIDQWVLTEACRMLTWEQQRGRAVHIEVNLSGSSMGDPSVCEFIEQRLADVPDPRGLIIEVTETEAITDLYRARTFAQRLAEIGCQFALDDFGAGYGSFFYLKHLPFDYLKIDGTFIRDLLSGGADEVVVRSLVQIAHELGKATVAEFVEDAATLAKLRELGVDFAQGHQIGRPGPLPGYGAVAARRRTPPVVRVEHRTRRTLADRVDPGA